ncbi:hypothetical protein F2P79_012341 [Pimephales promelas]|nr:hypothetical protein F2P79_012341 [Pimephales promelas]
MSRNSQEPTQEARSQDKRIKMIFQIHGEGEEGSRQEGGMERWSVYQGVLINSSVMRIETALMPFTTLRDRIKPNCTAEWGGLLNSAIYKRLALKSAAFAYEGGACKVCQSALVHRGLWEDCGEVRSERMKKIRDERDYQGLLDMSQSSLRDWK